MLNVGSNRALDQNREAATTFSLDPTTDPLVVQLVQRYGQSDVLGPLIQVSGAWIWAAHRSRMRLLGLEPQLRLGVIGQYTRDLN